MTKDTDRRRGAFLGLAVGDALGAAVEFKAPGTFPEVIGFRAGGPHRLEPGEWTDDTSMALVLGHSIVEAGWDSERPGQEIRELVEGRGVFRDRQVFRYRWHYRRGPWKVSTDG